MRDTQVISGRAAESREQPEAPLPSNPVWVARNRKQRGVMGLECQS